MLDPMQKTLKFLQKAIPEPTDRDRQTQLGCHCEEVVEMFDEIHFVTDPVAESYGSNVRYYLHLLAERLKGDEDIEIEILEPEKYLDALCDQQVTAMSVANSNGYQIYGAMDEVAESNLSKFEDGEPVRKPNGKIAKGVDYKEPVLGPYLLPIQ